MTRAQSLLKKANVKFSLTVAASLLASSTFIAAILGLLRDRFLNRAFEDLPNYLDAYLAAFRIPDFMYFVLVSGALSVTFIPVFNARLSSGNKQSAWDLSSSLLNLLAIVTLIASVLIMVFAEPLIRYVVAPGLPDDVRDLAIAMMRIVAINPFLFAISSLLASMQQAQGRFFFFTLAPVIYNLGIITGILVFTQELTIFGTTVWEGGIMGVALGVVFGSIMQLIVSSFGMIGMKFDYRPLIFWKNKGFQQVLGLLPARSFDQGIDYFTTLVETNVASRIGQGAISAYQFALNLHMMPINLIGVAIATAFFPKMTERLAEGRVDLFKKELQTVLRVIIWLAMPVAMFTFVCRGYIVALISSDGELVIATLLGILTIAILFRSVFHIASRTFYAQQDTKTPLYISIFVIALNILLVVVFYQYTTLGVYGLALAQSIVAATEVIVLFVIMQRRLKGLLGAMFWAGLTRMVAATGLAYIVTYAMIYLIPFTKDDRTLFAVVAKLSIIGLVSFGSYVVFSWLLRLPEVMPIIAKLQKTIFRSYQSADGSR
ncbi:murein biosynthesis integral membrane protein MurJ [Candidatus Saccharibacteria bacterium]|nr:murein biosynthesis integral membrane protein MurJ [Candidatus Saccharibacteria bacterium]